MKHHGKFPVNFLVPIVVVVVVEVTYRGKRIWSKSQKGKLLSFSENTIRPVEMSEKEPPIKYVA
jgi:hypothetical protein